MKLDYRALVSVVTVVAALMTPVRLRLAVQDQPQTKPPRYTLDTASYNFLIGSGFLCGADDSTACPVLARAGNGQTIEISAAGTLGFVNKSVTAAGAFTTSYSDTGLSPSTTYTYTVSPYDLTGNVSAHSTAASATTQGAVAVVHHYEYVVNDGSLTVYDVDALPAVNVVKTEIIPTGSGTRGAVACGNTLWVSYGSDSTQNLPNTPSLLAYDLVNDVVKWTHTYTFGIDSMSVTPDCAKIYMPEGELSSGGLWYVIDAATGNPTGATINSLGSGPHNTIISPNGQHVYMGPRYSANLVQGSVSTNSVIKQIGPETAGSSAGIRPFTIDGSESMAFVTLSGYLGFQVLNINTGALMYTVPVPGYSCSGGQTSAGATSCAHGISLSPNGKEIYLIDAGNTANHVHVFDVSGLPSAAPSLVNTITLNTSFSGNESPCAYDCLKDGWIHHGLDGRYVFVGDSGDVIDTATRSVIATLPAMTNTRKEIEIDFQNGLVVAAMTNRSSIGAATGGTAPSASLSTNSLNFNNQGLGTASSAQTVTVTNSGGSPLNITGVALSGANMADFAIASNSTCTNGSSVAVGANCVANLTFTPAATGNRIATLSITDNAAGSPQTVSLSGTGIDFTVAGPSTPINTIAGQPAMATITITPGVNGFPNPVSFSASNLPPFSLTSFSPPSVTPMDAAVTTVLTITTKHQGAGPVKGNTLTPLTGPLPGLWLSGALLALLSLVMSRRVVRTQRLAASLAVALLLWCGTVLAGCSSSSSGTPAATYMVTVTATSGQLSHSTTVTVVVQ